MMRCPPRFSLFPYTTLFRSEILSYCDYIDSAVSEVPDGLYYFFFLLSKKIGRAHSELQSPMYLVCRLLLEKKKKKTKNIYAYNNKCTTHECNSMSNLLKKFY